MSMYHAAFLRQRIGHGYALLLEIDPKIRQRKKSVGFLKPPKALLRSGGLNVKKRHRSDYLRSLFTSGSCEAAAILRTIPKERSLITTNVYQEGELVAFGIDHLGPFKEQLEKRFLLPGKKLVRRRVSFEELLFVYHDEDPDTLINQVFDLLAEAIVSIEAKYTEQQRKKIGPANKGG
jgi:hypothetical protein